MCGIIVQDHPIGQFLGKPDLRLDGERSTFQCLPPATRAQWEAVILKELKGRALTTLNVEVDGSALPPFHMAATWSRTGNAAAV